MSKKFDRDSRVIFRYADQLQRGRVTQVLPQFRRIITDSGQRLELPVRRLKALRDRVLILEGRLDRRLNSTREYAMMMKQWLSAYDIEALHERVHTKEALRQFLRKEGKNVNTRFVHIMGHGLNLTETGAAKLCLTFEEIDLIENANIFAGLDGKIILFSCCEVAANLRAMAAVKENSNAAAVIGYRVLVRDAYTNLAEALLYERLVNHPSESPKKAVERVNAALSEIGARHGDEKITRKPVFMCT